MRALTRYMVGLSDGHGHVELEGVPLREQRQWPFTLIEVTEASSKESLPLRALRMGESEAVPLQVPGLLQSEPVPRLSWRPFQQGYEDLDTETADYCVGSFVPLAAAFAQADPATRHELLAAQYDGYAEVFEGIVSRQTLLLDLRGNADGSDLLGLALALHLMDPGFHDLWLEAKRDGLWRRTAWQDPQVGRGTPRFSLPSSKARVRICTMRVHAPDGTPIEGNGVQPNVLVRASRAQLLAGDDAILEATLAAR